MSATTEGKYIASSAKHGNVVQISIAPISKAKQEVDLIISNKVFKWHSRSLHKYEINNEYKYVTFGGETLGNKLHSVGEILMAKDFRTNSNFYKLQKYINNDMHTMDYEVYGRKTWYHAINEMVKNEVIWYGKHEGNYGDVDVKVTVHNMLNMYGWSPCHENTIYHINVGGVVIFTCDGVEIERIKKEV